MSRISFKSRQSDSSLAFMTRAAVVALIMSAGLATAQSTTVGTPKHADENKTNTQRGDDRAKGAWGTDDTKRTLSPSKQRAAWEAQAKAVAKRMGATDAEAKKISAAYVESRKSQFEVWQKARQESMDRARQDRARQDGKDGQNQNNPGGSSSDRQYGKDQYGQDTHASLEKANTQEREKLSRTIAGILTPAQAQQAMTSLGTYNRQWDLMTSQIVSFNLSDDKEQRSLEAIETYVVAQEGFRSGSGNNWNRDGMNRDGMNPNGTNRDGTNRDGMNPNGTNRDGTNRDGMNPNGTNRDGTNRDGTNPNGTNRDGTNPNGTNRDGTNPNGTNRDGTNPTGTNPTGTNPTGTNPTGTNPTGTNPTGTNPTGTNPTGTNPTGTNPTGTNPTGTNPTGTNPTGTNPTGTNPQRNNPTGTNPSGTNPNGAYPTDSDRDTLRQNMRASRERLIQTLQGILNQEQLRQFEAVAFASSNRNQTTQPGSPGQSNDRNNMNDNDDYDYDYNYDYSLSDDK